MNCPLATVIPTNSYRISSSDRGGELLVLDAKNKGREGRGDFYGLEDAGSIREWRPEDMDKMHAYRDALTGAVGAFALYPGLKTPIYRVPGATRDCEGVGALPLRPRADATPEPEHRRRLGELIASFLAG